MSLACPDCFSGIVDGRCSACGRTFEVDDGVMRLRSRADTPSESERSYLSLYQQRPDPYRYEVRAAEVLKADAVMAVVDRLSRPGARVVEVGCSTGHITRRLATRELSLLASDLVPAAVTATRRSLEGMQVAASIDWCSANATRLPVARGSVDLVLLLDGPVSWKLSEADLDRVLLEAQAVLAPGGHALVMDYLNPSRFAELTGPVARHFDIVERLPLPDRPFYVLESSLKALRWLGPVRSLFRSLVVARALEWVGRWFGERGSKHLLLVCRRRRTVAI